MWRAGQDPALRMTVGNLLVLDRLPDIDELVGRLAAMAYEAPRLGWRLDDPSRSRPRPAWVAEDDFDARNHVRVLSLPPPGDLRQVLDLVSLVETAPFEPVRSPWDVTVIEGLEDGQAALYLRADHVLTDGVGGAALLRLLADRDAPAADADADADVDLGPEGDPPSGSDAPAAAAPIVSERRPGTVTVTVDLTSLARPVANGISAAMRIDPVDTVVRGVQRGVGIVNSVSRQLVVAGGPLSPVAPSGSMATHFSTLSLPGARQVAKRHGASRQVLLVAATAAGLGAYHELRGQPVAELRMATPVLRRSGGSGGANSFVPLRIEVPARFDHPGTQFGIVADRLAYASREPATQLTGVLTSAVNLLPGRALVAAVRSQVAAVDFVTTTLPGRRTLGTVCGARILASHPFGPRAGRLVNVTAFGNGDSLDLGIATDPVAIRDPEVLVECLQQAFARLADDAHQGAGS